MKVIQGLCISEGITVYNDGLSHATRAARQALDPTVFPYFLSIAYITP